MMDDMGESTPDEGGIRVAYCPACDREVRIRVSQGSGEPSSEAERAAPPRQLSGICLDVGEDCTGAFCPFGDQPVV
jgi:hypothetical protein